MNEMAVPRASGGRGRGPKARKAASAQANKSLACGLGRVIECGPEGRQKSTNFQWIRTMAIEPLYSLQVARELIPMPTMASLYMFLNQHKDEFPGVYRRHGGPSIARCGYETRLLTESDILKIREMTTHGLGDSRFARAGRPRKNGDSPLNWIIRRAMASG